MKRVLALAVACLLMAGALGVRNVLTDDDDDGDADGGEEGDLVVACIPELEAACRALEREVADLRIEDPGVTIDDPDVDAWVTLDPWPAMSEVDAFQNSVGVAQSELVLLARQADTGSCPDPVTWVCVVDLLGDRTVVNVDQALGLFALAQAANEFRPSFAFNDLRDDFELQDFISSIGRSNRDPIEDMLLLPDPDASGTSAADIASRVDRSARSDEFVRSPSGSPATVAVVVAGRRASRVHGEPAFTEALAALGWEVGPDAATTGLPDAGVLLALAQEVGS